MKTQIQTVKIRLDIHCINAVIFSRMREYQNTGSGCNSGEAPYGQNNIINKARVNAEIKNPFKVNLDSVFKKFQKYNIPRTNYSDMYQLKNILMRGDE